MTCNIQMVAVPQSISSQRSPFDNGSGELRKLSERCKLALVAVVVYNVFGDNTAALRRPVRRMRKTYGRTQQCCKDFGSTTRMARCSIQLKIWYRSLSSPLCASSISPNEKKYASCYRRRFSLLVDHTLTWDGERKNLECHVYHCCLPIVHNIIAHSSICSVDAEGGAWGGLSVPSRLTAQFPLSQKVNHATR